MNRHTLRSKANRLRVFRALKAYMDAHQRTPTVAEIADETGLSLYAAGSHMRALNGADGLPLPAVLRHGTVALNLVGASDRCDRVAIPIDELIADDRPNYAHAKMKAGMRSL